MSSGLSEVVLAFRRNNGKGENAVLCFGGHYDEKNIKNQCKTLISILF